MKQFNPLKLVRVNSNYCDFLRQYDSKVSYNAGIKELRPFVGVLFKVNEVDYFAPLSSPKKKHLIMKDTVDFMKIDEGKLGAINFNNMIPLIPESYKIIDLNKETLTNEELKYQNMLKNQLEWLNGNIDKVRKKSKILYSLYDKDMLYPNIKKRCCNFKLLEEICKNYELDNDDISSSSETTSSIHQNISNYYESNNITNKEYQETLNEVDSDYEYDEYDEYEEPSSPSSDDFEL